MVDPSWEKKVQISHFTVEANLKSCPEDTTCGCSEMKILLMRQTLLGQFKMSNFAAQ